MMTNGVGRLRCKLAELLSAHGFVVQARDIRQNAPAYRTYSQSGIAWEVWASKAGYGGVRLFSYDTMAQCCDKGVTVSKPDGGLYEVSAVSMESGQPS
jgi:hypothetical protein